MKHISVYEEVKSLRWGKEENEWTEAKQFKPYVYGTSSNNALIHRVRRVRLRWWVPGPRGQYLVRLKSPGIIAETICNRSVFIDGTKGKTCELPKPDAVLCKACLGMGRNFPKGKPHEVPISVAKVKLGCVEVPL